MIQTFVVLPLCIDREGHRFTIPPTSSWSVCQRCGLTRNPLGGGGETSALLDEVQGMVADLRRIASEYEAESAIRRALDLIETRDGLSSDAVFRDVRNELLKGLSG